MKRKKNQDFFQVADVYWWVDEREKNREIEHRDEERRERDSLYYFIV